MAFPFTLDKSLSFYNDPKVSINVAPAMSLTLSPCSLVTRPPLLPQKQIRQTPASKSLYGGFLCLNCPSQMPLLPSGHCWKVTVSEIPSFILNSIPTPRPLVPFYLRHIPAIIISHPMFGFALFEFVLFEVQFVLFVLLYLYMRSSYPICK